MAENENPLDRILSQIKSETSAPIFNNLIRISAAIGSFKLSDIKKKHIKLYQEEPSKRDISELESCTIKYHNNSEWFLKEHYRKDIFQEIDTNNNLSVFLNSVPLNPDDFVQNILRDLLKYNGELIFESYNINQLNAILLAIKWLSSTNYKTLASIKPSVLAILKRKELIETFYDLTNNFSGRVDHLNQLKEYVNYLPQKTFKGRVENRIRNFISFQEKPPLMIFGNGGVGKSTLISKFIVDHISYKSENKIPFIYIDFDKHDFLEKPHSNTPILDPLTLIYDGLRQLSLQFTEHKEKFQKLRNNINQKYDDDENYVSSSIEWKNVVSKLTEILEIALGKERLSKSPFLMVFDSFEEIEYRASETEVNNWFEFLDMISLEIPRFRPVIVGRNRLINNKLKIEPLELLAFDLDSSVGYLKSRGVTDEKISHFLFKRFGGNPLTLELCANLIKANSEKEILFEDLKQSSWLKKIDENLIQEELFKRNLAHIHDKEVRQIALLGLILRKIDPLIIQKVLAEPSGLGKISIQRARRIYELLIKEKFLIEVRPYAVYFRTDLRTSLYGLIKLDNPESTAQIHERAADFYSDKLDNPSELGEFAYHQIMLGKSLNFLKKHNLSELKKHLDFSFKEFSDDTLSELFAILNLKPNNQMLYNSSIERWKEFMFQESKIVFEQNAISGLKGLSDRIKTRINETSDVELNYLQCFLEFRLRNYTSCINLIYKNLEIIKFPSNQMEEDIKNELLLKNTLLLSRSYEYLERYDVAYQTLKPFDKDWKTLPFDVQYQVCKLQDRIGIIDGFIDTPEDTSYKGWIKFLGSYVEGFKGRPLRFYSANTFGSKLRENYKRLPNDKELARKFEKTYGNMFVQHFAPGDFEILIHEYTLEDELCELSKSIMRAAPHLNSNLEVNSTNTNTSLLTIGHLPPFLGKTYLPFPFYLLFSTSSMSIFTKIFRNYNRQTYSSPYSSTVHDISFKINALLARSPFFGIFRLLALLWGLIQAWLLISPSLSTSDFGTLSLVPRIIRNSPYFFHEKSLTAILICVIVLFAAVKGFRKRLKKLILFFVKFPVYLVGKNAGNWIQSFWKASRLAELKTQQNIYRYLKSQTNIDNIIIHPFDLNFIKAGKVKTRFSFENQLNELIDFTSKVDNNASATICIDPRRIKEDSKFFNYSLTHDKKIILEECRVKELLNSGFVGFYIFPDAGYYPFDDFILPILLFACQNNIPVFANCGNTELFYRGTKRKEWNYHPIFKDTNYSLRTRLDSDNDLPKMKLKEMDNLHFTKNFSHPLNFLCLLDNQLLMKKLENSEQHIQKLFGYNRRNSSTKRDLKNLKICFCGFGGPDEWKRHENSHSTFGIRPLKIEQKARIGRFQNRDGNISLVKLKYIWDLSDWYSIICAMMHEYPNVYADLSGIFGNAELYPLLRRTLSTDNVIIRKRVLFATGFSILNLNKTERQLSNEVMTELSSQEFELISQTNFNDFFRS
tara:strand:+ start:13633 stop:18060 length:4428 start_codon:yes stop_codon:yes gene_type:complete